MIWKTSAPPPTMTMFSVVPAPNPAHFALAKLENALQDAFSCAPKTWTTSTSRPGRRSTLFTCTASYSRAAAIRAAAHPLRTPTFTSRQPNSPVANAAAESAPTSAGSAKCRSSWIASSAHWTNAHSSLLWGRRAWSSQRELCRACARSGADDLRRAGGTRECFRLHGMPFGEGRGDIA